MRISSFIPAILAFSLFSASTQALPMPDQEPTVAMLKRAVTTTDLHNPSAVLQAIVNLFVEVDTKILLDACVQLEAELCADVSVKLDVSVSTLPPIITLPNLQAQANAQACIAVKAIIQADIQALVIAKIAGHVKVVVPKICPGLTEACLSENAALIVADVTALIKVDIEAFCVDIQANLALQVQANVNAFLKVLLGELGLLGITVTAVITVSVNISAQLMAFITLCVELLINAQLIADIAAL